MAAAAHTQKPRKVTEHKCADELYSQWHKTTLQRDAFMLA